MFCLSPWLESTVTTAPSMGMAPLEVYILAAMYPFCAILSPQYIIYKKQSPYDQKSKGIV
jgi:hypothetical protein